MDDEWQRCNSLPGPERNGCILSFRKKKQAEVNVWTYRVGGWADSDRSGGFSYCEKINSLGDIAKFLEKKKLQGAVAHLGIVAHGDAPGRVVLDRVLNSQSVDGFESEFKQLGKYLKADAILAFYACIAGQYEDGSSLLEKISNFLPGRTIVAFSVYGYLGPFQNLPGVVQAANDSQIAPKDKALGFLDPWCRWAKRAKDGKVVHVDILSQNKDPKKRCAKKGCGGHAAVGDACPGYY